MLTPPVLSVSLSKSLAGRARSGGGRVEVEPAPADFFESKAVEDRRRHVTTPNDQAAHAGLAGGPEARRDQGTVDPATSEFRPHRTARDGGARGRKQADSGAARRLVVDHRQQ